MRFGSYIAYAGLTLLGACHAVPPAYPTPADKQEVASAKAPSSQAAAEATAASVIKAQLRDPESARITFSPVKHGTVILFDIHNNGYFLCGTVNAKNAYGGYAGAEDYVVYLSHFYPDSDGTAVLDTHGTGALHNVCLTFWRAD